MPYGVIYSLTMERLLVLKEAFRKELAKEYPGHPHLPIIDAGISLTRAEIALFNQSTSGLTSERVGEHQLLQEQGISTQLTPPQDTSPRNPRDETLESTGDTQEQIAKKQIAGSDDNPYVYPCWRGTLDDDWGKDGVHLESDRFRLW